MAKYWTQLGSNSAKCIVTLLISGVTIGRARRAVHAGPALWGAQNLPDAVFFKSFFWGRGGPFGILARGPTATLLRHCCWCWVSRVEKLLNLWVILSERQFQLMCSTNFFSHAVVWVLQINTFFSVLLSWLHFLCFRPPKQFQILAFMLVTNIFTDGP